MRFGPQNIFGVSKLKLIQNTVKTDRVKEGYFHNVSVVAVDAEGNEQEIATFYNLDRDWEIFCGPNRIVLLLFQ